MNIQTLRIIGLLEGISFILLLAVAMPIKYVYGNPIWVEYMGMGHGILVIAFLLLLMLVCDRQKLSLHVFVTGLIAAILPLGTFFYDIQLKKLQH
jgi:integral membrane protein